MSKSRSAHAAFLGIDFQINAAIVLMIENINELRTMRLESNNEDIDIELISGKHILAQAKAVENSSRDFSNVRANLKKALLTLSEGSQKVRTEKLIFITNSPNPLNDYDSYRVFWGPSLRSYDKLPESAQKIISGYLAEIEQPLDTDKFVIQVIPFETDNDTERYKAIMQAINDFIGELSLDIPGLGKKLHRIWKDDVFKSGTKKDENIKLSKNDLIWPIIVIVTDIDRIDRDFAEQFDDVQYDEIVRRYHELIDSCCERVEFFTRVLYDFSVYNYNGNPKEKSLNFVKDHWQEYAAEIKTVGMDDDTAAALSKVLIYSVIRRRYDIDRIKKGVSL